jgi:hypothetical protein
MELAGACEETPEIRLDLVVAGTPRKVDKNFFGFLSDCQPLSPSIFDTYAIRRRNILHSINAF